MMIGERERWLIGCHGNDDKESKHESSRQGIFHFDFAWISVFFSLWFSFLVWLWLIWLALLLHHNFSFSDFIFLFYCQIRISGMERKCPLGGWLGVGRRYNPPVPSICLSCHAHNNYQRKYKVNKTPHIVMTSPTTMSSISSTKVQNTQQTPMQC